jgi:curved DNA-binding protein CbpA
MLQAQGTRPPDPYRTLQVHPLAGRELIMQVYWSLVERARAMRPAAEADQQLAELNAAYALLMDERRRRDWDEAAGLRDLAPPSVSARTHKGGFLGWFTRTELVVECQDWYQLLQLDREATPATVAIAAEHARRTAPPAARAEDVRMRELIEEACRVLTDANLRAQYDATLEGEAAAATVDAPEEPEPIAVPGAAARADEYASAEDDERALAVPEEHSRARPAPPKVIPIWFRRTRRDAATVALVEALTDSAPPEEPAPEPRGSRAGKAAAPAADRARRLPRGERLHEAERERLLGLRTLAESAREEDASPAAADTGTLAHLVFTSGPLQGTRVPLDGAPMTIGEGFHADIVLPARGRGHGEIARLWAHGGAFAFRCEAGIPVRVNGRPLEAPLVILEHGDEVRIGAHRFQFLSR